MIPKKTKINLLDNDLDQLRGTHRFSHEAMATNFDIFIAYEDAEYARQSAQAAFTELDRLEAELSHFIENSDISRINKLAADKPLVVDLDTFNCLQIAVKMHSQTNGAFDVTVGTLMKCLLNKDKSLRSPSKEELDHARLLTGTQFIKLDETNFAVQLDRTPLKIDLGAIGKGYAVDRMAELLGEWSIYDVLISGGSSSVLALGYPPEAKGWPLTISDPTDRNKTLVQLCVTNRALSGSGLETGRHIIDPRTTEPVEGKIAAWACAPDAATSDALSTAFMVMSAEEIKNFCKKYSDICAMFIPKDKKKKTPLKPVRSGDWQKFIQQ
jgi:thiamine biosynthesis lipoprotein